MSTNPMTSSTVFFGRLFWMMLGPMVLAVLAITIVLEGTGWLTLLDFAYFLVLGGMLLGRWLEFRSGNAMTSTGEPATPEHHRRYFMGASLLGLGLWVVVNLLGNHVLPR